MLYTGISDAPAWWIAQANTLAHLRGWSPFVGLQIEYSLIERTVERELIPMAKALNIGVTAWSPLAGGVLTGKYHGHGAPEGGRMNSDMLKDFMPERAAERTHRRRRQESVRRDRPQHGAGGAGVASLSTRAGHSDHRRAEAVAVPGQSRELRCDALSQIN